MLQLTRRSDKMANDVTGRKGTNWTKLKDLPPDHMDDWVRNERLYLCLRDKGLWVEPVFDEHGRLDHMKVSVVLPKNRLSSDYSPSAGAEGSKGRPYHPVRRV
jgi:hypothetical protein